MPGTIVLSQGAIELFGCTAGGKEYESLVRLDCDCRELDLALKMIGLRPGPAPERVGDPSVKQGSRVLTFVRWTEGEKPFTFRAEDLAYNVKSERTMPRVGWTFVADWIEVPDPTRPGKATYKVLGASSTRSLLTTYRAAEMLPLLENPLPDAVDDSLYIANSEILPEAGKGVLVFFRAPSEEELKEILALEKKYE